MEEGKRQKQVAGAIQVALNDIFLKLGLNHLQGGMVSISSVKVTPDLLEARAQWIETNRLNVLQHWRKLRKCISRMAPA